MNIHFLKQNRNIPYSLLLFLVFLVTVPVGLTPWVYSDGVGDYAWVRTVFMDGDLDCSNEFSYFVDLFKRKYGWPDATNDLYPVKTKTGLQANKYPIGSAILWSPFFLLGHGFTIVMNSIGVTDYPTDGYSKPYIFFVSLGSAIYGFLALLLSFYLVRRYYSEKLAFVSTLAIWFASSIPVYMYLYPSMPHNTGFFTVSIFLYYFLTTYGDKRKSRWAVLGALGGLMMLTRMESFVLLFLPMIELLYIHRGRYVQLFSREYVARLGFYSLSAFLVFLPQMMVWQHVFGKFFLNPYSEMNRLVKIEKALRFGGTLPEGGHQAVSGLSSFLQFISHPDFHATLVGSSYGIFTWTPILFLAFAGVFFIYRKNKYLFFINLAGAILLVYITSCSHKQGMSYGDRYLIKASTFFIFGFTAFLEVLSKKIKMWVPYILIALLVIWNGLFIVQYSTGLVNRSGPINWKKMIRNQFEMAPKFFLKHIVPFLKKRSDVYKGNKANQTDLNLLREKRH